MLFIAKKVKCKSIVIGNHCHYTFSGEVCGYLGPSVNGY